MGLLRGTIKLLMREAIKKPFSGKLLTIGRQDVYATAQDIHKWAKELGYILTPQAQLTLSSKDIFRNKGFISDSSFFLSLGFDSIESMDYSDFEKCTIVHNLDIPVPDNLHDRYDLIIDSGTSEHIFDIPQVFENYNRMLKTGGTIIHILPSSNHIDHGLYMFSPTLFCDYYSANKWKIVESLFVRYSYLNEVPESPFFNMLPWRVFEYVPGNLDTLHLDGIKGMYLIFFVAQKTIHSTWNAPVQQRVFVRQWNLASQTISSDSTKARPSDARMVIKYLVKLLPSNIRRCLAVTYDHMVVRKLPLKLVARY